MKNTTEGNETVGTSNIALDRVVERLRASKNKIHEEQLAEGEALGQEWAAEEAEEDELRRLEKAGDPVVDWTDDEDTAHLEFLAIIDPNDNLDHGQFWQSVTGSAEPPSDAFVQGFARAAVRVWETVKRRL